MFSKFTNEIKCEVCSGDLHFDYDSTVDDYQILMSSTTVDIYDKVDDIVGKYLVYKCYICGRIHKYTYKDIEKIVRRKITERVLLSMVKDQIPDISSVVNEKFFIYCGKCQGVDGTGCCTKNVFNNCVMKRFSINGL